MPLILAHGQPKSASTFLFETARWAIGRHNGLRWPEFAKKIGLGSEYTLNYVEQPTDEILDAIGARLPEDGYYVLKTHGELTPRIRSGIGSGKIVVLTSFRDPRDCLVSLLDAFEKEMAREGRPFSKQESIESAMRYTNRAWAAASDWANSDNSLKIPYYLTATDHARVVKLVCEFIGLGRFTNSTNRRFSREYFPRVHEFNKGVADRFLDVLSPSDIATATRSLEGAIREIDQLTEQWMIRYGHREAYESLHNRREQRLANILGRMQATGTRPGGDTE
jgi:hypothetical protein